MIASNVTVTHVSDAATYPLSDLIYWSAAAATYSGNQLYDTALIRIAKGTND